MCDDRAMTLDRARQVAAFVHARLGQSPEDSIRELAQFVLDLAPYLEQVVVQATYRSGGTALDAAADVARLTSVTRDLVTVLTVTR